LMVQLSPGLIPSRHTLSGNPGVTLKVFFLAPSGARNEHLDFPCGSLMQLYSSHSQSPLIQLRGCLALGLWYAQVLNL